MSTAAPPTPAARHRYLDLLRGVALLGILPVNMAFFGRPVLEQGAPPDLGVASAVARHATAALFEFKFLTLFALLFGVGLMLQRQRADAAGRRFGPPMARRTFEPGPASLSNMPVPGRFRSS